MDIKGYYGNAAYGVGLNKTVAAKNTANADIKGTKAAVKAGSPKFAEFLSAAASGTANAAGSASASGAVDKQDRLEIDYDALFEQVKSRIASAVDADTNLRRIQQLQAGYAGKSVPVSSGDVAGAIL